MKKEKTINYTTRQKNDKKLHELLTKYPFIRKIEDGKKTIYIFKA